MNEKPTREQRIQFARTIADARKTGLKEKAKALKNVTANLKGMTTPTNAQMFAALKNYVDANNALLRQIAGRIFDED